MISITQIIQSVDIRPIKDIGMVLNDPFLYCTLIILLVVAGERKKKKMIKILFSLLLAALLAIAAKEAFSHSRPCVGEEWCPGGYSFPSIHTVIAFTLMTAFIRRKEYPAYLLFALFVAFSRINIGVHVFQDIVAALPIALVSYYITWTVVKDEDGV
jgi:membrane-associated phospholipid phosphatase